MLIQVTEIAYLQSPMIHDWFIHDQSVFPKVFASMADLQESNAAMASGEASRQCHDIMTNDERDGWNPWNPWNLPRRRQP